MKSTLIFSRPTKLFHFLETDETVFAQICLQSTLPERVDPYSLPPRTIVAPLGACRVSTRTL
eukprot:6573318-Pyramimonas_sp.AAC.1